VEQEEFKATVNFESKIGLREATEDNQPREIIVHRTISIGLATFPADADDPKTLLEKADEALYAAKNTGRNRVCLSSYPEKSLPIIIQEAS
jgi:diguanylate cyclase (GGDEF)-like protein